MVHRYHVPCVPDVPAYRQRAGVLISRSTRALALDLILRRLLHAHGERVPAGVGDACRLELQHVTLAEAIEQRLHVHHHRLAGLRVTDLAVRRRHDLLDRRRRRRPQQAARDRGRLLALLAHQLVEDEAPREMEDRIGTKRDLAQPRGVDDARRVDAVGEDDDQVATIRGRRPDERRGNAVEERARKSRL